MYKDRFDETEYKQQDTVTKFMKNEGINCLSISSSGECPYCGIEQEEEQEAYFSHNKCECCSGLPGNRYHATGYHEVSKEILCYEVCPECIYEASYGESMG